MSSSSVRIGLIGCGRIARMFHLPVLSQLPAVEVVALADPDADCLRQASGRFPRAATFTDYHDLLRDDTVDAVVICLPTAMHAEAAVVAFDAARHVYLEKPIATTLDDARRVLQAAERSGRIGMIGFNYRFHPLIRQAKERIGAGDVGRITAIRSVFSSASRPLPTWKTRRETGGGALLDLGSHHFDLIPHLAGAAVADVQATIQSVRVEDDIAAVQLRLANGITAQSFFSISAVDEDRIEIIGDRGKLTIDRLGSRLLRFAPPQRDGSRKGRVLEAIRAVLQTPRRVADGLRSQVEPSQKPALAAFVEAVRQNQPAPVDLQAGYRSLATIIAAEQSAQSGQRVAVDGAPPVAAITAAADNMPPLDLSDPARPALSAVVVATSGFAGVRRTVRHLRGQTIADRIELIIVAPQEQAIADAAPNELEGFFAVRILAVGPIDHIDACAAKGIQAASADVVASIEDHAFPDPDWAEQVLRGFSAEDGQWSAVASFIANGNPATSLSWTNFLLGYGAWYGPLRGGTIDRVSQHNICLRRSALGPLLDDLPSHMGRSGSLLPDLRRMGRRFYFAPGAKLRHINPSRLDVTVSLRFHAGRLAAGSRASMERFSPLKRAIYTAASPLFPLLRLRTLRGKLGESGPRVFPSLLAGLLLDAAGQALGFAFGPGAKTRDGLARFEFDRVRHVRADERNLLME